jgi:hypothetical protein
MVNVVLIYCEFKPTVDLISFTSDLFWFHPHIYNYMKLYERAHDSPIFSDGYFAPLKEQCGYQRELYFVLSFWQLYTPLPLVTCVQRRL